VRGTGRHFFQSGGDDLFDLVQQDRRRPARPRLIGQPVQPPRGEPPAPFAHVFSSTRRSAAACLFVAPVRAGQHDLGPQRQRLLVFARRAHRVS